MLFSRDRKPKFAFVLGIGTYLHAQHLANPVHDTAAVSAELKRAGYDVETWIDLDKRNIETRIEAFIKRAGTCDTLLIYYSGHGIQLADGASLKNYIVPKDFSFDADDPIRGLVSVQHLLDRMSAAENKIIFLDACRDTAGLERTLRAAPSSGPGQVSAPEMGGSGISVAGTRSIGLSALRPLHRPQLKVGTFLAFASEAGELADDGREGHLSPFTAAVVRYIGTRGLDVVTMAQLVAKDVRAATEGRQVPWTNSNLVDTCQIYDRDPGPVWIMGALGALSGAVSAIFLIDVHRGGPDIQPPILADVIANKLLLLSSLPLGATLGFGAYMWGRKTRSPWLGIATGVLFVVIAAAMRLWFAGIATVEKLKPIYEAIGHGDLKLSDLRSVDPVFWYVLVLSILVTTFIGMSTILVGHIFFRSMRDIPRLATGALLGAAAVPLFLIFAAVNSLYVALFGGLHTGFQIASIVLSGMIWEGALGANAGWAYWWHVALPDNREPLNTAAAPSEPEPELKTAPGQQQAVDRFWGPATAAISGATPNQTGNRGTA